MAILNLAIFQNDSAPANKGAQLQALDNAAQVAAKHGAQLMLCPELFMTGYYIKNQMGELAETAQGPFISQAINVAKNNNIALVFGYPEKYENCIYNSAIAINKNGESVCNFRKLHLPGDFEKSNFCPGDKFVEFEIEGIKTSILICYDSEYPEAVRKLAISGIELLLVPTALSKLYGVVAQKVIPSRAFENGIFIAYADCCGEDNGLEFAGQSCIVDPHGDDLARAGIAEEIIYAYIDTAQIDYARTALPYLKELRPNLYIDSLLSR